MSKDLKQRRETLSLLVARMEAVMTDLCEFQQQEKAYSSAYNVAYAEQSLDDAITSLNNHELENL